MAQTPALHAPARAAAQAQAEQAESGYWLFVTVAPATFALMVISLILLRS